MKEKFLRFMQGRYGADTLSKVLLGAGLIVVLLSAFLTRNAVGMVFYLLGWVLIIYCYFRIFSRNVSKRYAENQAFLAKTYKIRMFFQRQKSIWKQRKVYHIYKCPAASRRSVSREEKERSRSAARSAALHLSKRAENSLLHEGMTLQFSIREHGVNSNRRRE